MAGLLLRVDLSAQTFTNDVRVYSYSFVLGGLSGSGLTAYFSTPDDKGLDWPLGFRISGGLVYADGINGEAAPETVGGGRYRTDFAVVSTALGQYVGYGDAVIDAVPVSLDASQDGFPDILQWDQPGNFSTSGSIAYLDLTQFGARQDRTTTLTFARAKGAASGTCRLSYYEFQTGKQVAMSGQFFAPAYYGKSVVSKPGGTFTSSLSVNVSPTIFRSIVSANAAFPGGNTIALSAVTEVAKSNSTVLGTAYLDDLILTQRISGNFKGYVGRARKNREVPAEDFLGLKDYYIVVDCPDTDEDGSLDLTDDTPLGVPSSFTGAGKVVGEAGRAIVPVTVGVSPTCRNFVASGLPPGLAINLTSGVISGTPTTAGIYPFSVTARAKAGLAPATSSFTAQIGGVAQTLPFTEDFSRLVPNRYLFSSTNLPPRMIVANGMLEYRSDNPSQNIAWATPSLLLALTNSWDLQVDARVPTNWPAGEAKVGVSLLKEIPSGTFDDILPNRINLKFGVGAEAGNFFEYHHYVDGAETTRTNLIVTNGGLARLRLLFHGGTRTLTLYGASYNGANLTPWVKLGEESLAPGQGLGQSWGLALTNRLRLALWGQTDNDNGNANGTRRMALDNLSVSLVTPPRITGPANFNGQVGVSFSNRITATNGQTYFTATNLPAGLTLNEATGIISGIPQVAGRLTNCRVGAGNPAASSEAPIAFTILPAFTSASTVTGFVNDLRFAHPVTVGTHNFGANMRFSATGLPTGMTINATSGLISGKPTVAGRFPATVTITANGVSASQRVDFRIQGAAGGVFSLTLNPRPTSVTGLPAGLSYNKTTGVISGTPQVWGDFTATGQLSNSTTSNINIPVMPSVPVIAGPTNWNAQVGQEARYQIVAGGFGREWAGWDGFDGSSPSTNWISSGPLAAFRTNGTTKSGLGNYRGRLSLTHGGTTNQVGSGYLVWARTIPVGARWVAMVESGISTNLNLIRRTNNLGQATNGQWISTKLNLLRAGSEVAEGTRLTAELDRSPEEGNILLARINGGDGELGKLSAPGDSGALALRYDAFGTIYSEGFPEQSATWQTLHSLSVGDMGLTSSNQWRLAVGGFSEYFRIEQPGLVWWDNFVLLPDPGVLMYRAYLVNSNGTAMTDPGGNPYLPEGLDLFDNMSGAILGIPSAILAGGTYRIRVEAEYNSSLLPIQGLPPVKGVANLTLTLLPAFRGASSATGFLNVAGNTHQVAVGTHSFGSNLKFSATGLPTGTTINATSGLISGKPTVAGTFGTRVTITAGTATAFKDIQISVYNGDGNRWAVGSPVSYQVNLGTGVTGYQASGLPTGMTINATTGLISGTPKEAGEYSVTVTVPARGLSTMIPFFIRPIYVNLAATGANNGTSWANAYTNLQTAINAAGAGAQIWVKAGTYKPTSYLDPKVTNDLRSRSFLLKGGVSVLGGFAGTETQLDQRDVESNPTILSGDFGGNDSATWPPDSSRDENAYHVVVAVNQATPIVLDGLTITGGNANNSTYKQPNNGSVIPAGTNPHEVGGGGIILNTDFVIRNSLVENNVAVERGGFLVYNQNPPAIRKFRAVGSIFAHNLATYGDGGALDFQADSRVASSTGQYMVAELVRCVFEDNEARTGPDQDNPPNGYPDGGNGAAVHLKRATALIVSCAFQDNYANGNGQFDYTTPGQAAPQGEGGGVFARQNCTLRIANCLFAGNRCDREGGAIAVEVGVAIQLYTSVFYNNANSSPLGWGGAAIGGWYKPSRGDLANSLSGFGNIFWQNQGNAGEITMVADATTPRPSTLTGTLTTSGVLYNNTGTIVGGNPQFADAAQPAGADGIWFTADDGLRIGSGSSAREIVNSVRPADFADLDEDGNTTELLPYDAAGVTFAPNPPYNAGAYQTVAP